MLVGESMAPEPAGFTHVTFAGDVGSVGKPMKCSVAPS